MAKKKWIWNNFRGGLADNPFLPQEGQYQEGLNIDVQTEPNGFKLVSDFENIVTVASAPNVILDLADFGSSGIYTFCADGEIYKDSSSTPIYTDATGSAIVAATAMWVSSTLYIYYFTSIGVIHRINTDGTGHTTKGALTGSTVYPIVKYGGDIYFGDKNTFKKLDSAENISTIFTAAKENTFTGLTFFQDSFNIYSRLGDATNPRDGQQFIIRLGSTSPSYITRWDRLPILGAANQGAIDYVVTGAGPNYSDLYMVSGTQRQLVKSNFEGMAVGRKFSSKIVSWKDELFILGWNRETSTSVNGKSIFRLGKYFPGMPNALTEIFRGDSGWEVYSLLASYNKLYFGKKGTGGYYTLSSLSLDTPTSSNYQTNGYIVSEVFRGESTDTPNTLEEIKIYYMCDATNPYFPHGGTITMFARTNPGDSFTQVGSAYTKTDIGCIRIDPQEICDAGLDDFYLLELKCQITRGSTTTSPLVTGIVVTYNDNQDR